MPQSSPKLSFVADKLRGWTATHSSGYPSRLKNTAWVGWALGSLGCVLVLWGRGGDSPLSAPGTLLWSLFGWGAWAWPVWLAELSLAARSKGAPSPIPWARMAATLGCWLVVLAILASLGGAAGGVGSTLHSLETPIGPLAWPLHLLLLLGGCYLLAPDLGATWANYWDWLVQWAEYSALPWGRRFLKWVNLAFLPQRTQPSTKVQFPPVPSEAPAWMSHPPPVERSRPASGWPNVGDGESSLSPTSRAESEQQGWGGVQPLPIPPQAAVRQTWKSAEAASAPTERLPPLTLRPLVSDPARSRVPAPPFGASSGGTIPPVPPPLSTMNATIREVPIPHQATLPAHSTPFATPTPDAGSLDQWDQQDWVDDEVLSLLGNPLDSRDPNLSLNKNNTHSNSPYPWSLDHLIGDRSPSSTAESLHWSDDCRSLDKAPLEQVDGRPSPLGQNTMNSRTNGDTPIETWEEEPWDRPTSGGGSSMAHPNDPSPPSREPFPIAISSTPPRQANAAWATRDRVVAAKLDGLGNSPAPPPPPDPPNPHYLGTLPQLPPRTLLDNDLTVDPEPLTQWADGQAKVIDETLAHFGIAACVREVQQGPVITRFSVQPEAGVRVSQIQARQADLALALAAVSLRIEAPIPGQARVGIEVAHGQGGIVRLGPTLAPERPVGGLHVSLGRNMANEPLGSDLTRLPHLLIAGQTGSGKSMALNALILSIICQYPPEYVRLMMIDPKRVELIGYNGIPHLLKPVVTEIRPVLAGGRSRSEERKPSALEVLQWLLWEMDRRFRLFAAIDRPGDPVYRNIEQYSLARKSGAVLEPLPYIVLVIDELADLMAASAEEVEPAVCRLAQLARATGIHLVLATQRPSVNVLTGTIKANFPARLAFAVATGVDSRVILDQGGADQLIGRGDALFSTSGDRLQRLQGTFVSDEEIERVVDWWKARSSQGCGNPLPIIDLADGQPAEVGTADGELLAKAISLVQKDRYASVSMLQRRLEIGYSRAGRIMDKLKEMGVVNKVEGRMVVQPILPDPDLIDPN